MEKKNKTKCEQPYCWSFVQALQFKMTGFYCFLTQQQTAVDGLSSSYFIIFAICEQMNHVIIMFLFFLL